MNKLTQKITVALFCGISATVVPANGADFEFNAEAAMPSSVKTCSEAINYQGVLVDPATGNPYVNGIYKFDVRLYKSESDVTPLWGAQYEAYVKDGYFNLMLGDGGAMLTVGELPTTYKEPAELWKALWLTTAGDNKSLYIGITMRQDSANKNIDTTKLREISPRQRLLSAPYAFRAERATYADRATQNFEVPGDLNVKGGFSLAEGGDIAFGQFSSSSTSAKVGTSMTSPTEATLQGGTVIVNSNGDQNFNPGGNVNFQMDAEKTFNVKDGNVLVESERVAVTGSMGVTVSGKTLDLLTTSGNIFLGPCGGKSSVVGAGTLLWKSADNAEAIKPFNLQTVSVKILKDNITGNNYILKDTMSISGAKYAEEKKLSQEYLWTVVGWVLTGGSSDADMHVVSACQVQNLHTLDTGYWPNVSVIMSKKCSADRTLSVKVLGVHRKLCAGN